VVDVSGGPKDESAAHAGAIRHARSVFPWSHRRLDKLAT
jgi:hypothetical protein